MKNIAIHPKHWREFCDAFTQINNGSVMSVELIHLDNRRDEIASEEMFQKMTLDTGDACNDMVSFTFENENGRRMNHVVIEPIHLRIKERADGQKLIQIEAENGVTRVHFHSGRFPELNFESEFSDVGKNKPIRSLAIPS